jgi:hypothetical protein
MELHSILPTLTLKEIDKSFIEVKLDGAVFDVPLQALLSPVTRPYGAWQDMQSQFAEADNVGIPAIYRTIDFVNGISVVPDNNSRLTNILFTKTGIYNLQFSAQFQNIDNTEQDVTIWLRKNGYTSAADVQGTSGYTSIPKSRGTNTPGHSIVGWNYYIDANPGDFYQLMWSTTDRTKVTMQYYAAGDPPPATASIILTVHQL